MASTHPDPAATSLFRIVRAGQPAAAKRRPRPPRPDGSEAFWLSPPLRRAVDRWTAAQPDPKPDRADAVRQLLERGLSG